MIFSLFCSLLGEFPAWGSSQLAMVDNTWGCQSIRWQLWGHGPTTLEIGLVLPFFVKEISNFCWFETPLHLQLVLDGIGIWLYIYIYIIHIQWSLYMYIIYTYLYIYIYEIFIYIYIYIYIYIHYILYRHGYAHLYPPKRSQVWPWACCHTSVAAAAWSLTCPVGDRRWTSRSFPCRTTAPWILRTNLQTLRGQEAWILRN